MKLYQLAPYLGYDGIRVCLKTGYSQFIPWSMTFYDHESPIFQGLFLGASPIWGVS